MCYKTMKMSIIVVKYMKIKKYMAFFFEKFGEI